jgi:hypothetical protein
MNPESKKEADWMVKQITQDFYEKFERGAVEHAGQSDDFKNLSALDLLYQSLGEKYDDLAYTLKAIKKLEDESSK